MGKVGGWEVVGEVKEDVIVKIAELDWAQCRLDLDVGFGRREYLEPGALTAGFCSLFLLFE